MKLTKTQPPAPNQRNLGRQKKVPLSRPTEARALARAKGEPGSSAKSCCARHNTELFQQSRFANTLRWIPDALPLRAEALAAGLRERCLFFPVRTPRLPPFDKSDAISMYRSEEHTSEL